MTTESDLRMKTEREIPRNVIDNKLLSRQTGAKAFNRLIVVSNRLPVTISKNKDGEVQIGPSSGGLVTALSPVLRKSAGLWMGWPGSTTDIHLNGQLDQVSEQSGYALKTIMLSKKELDDYYLGFSNQTLWPLFHDFTESCKFDTRCWQTYREVNRKFAQKVTKISNPDDYIWVQDYHLLLMANEFDRIGIKRQTGFFLHIPFPPPDLFTKIPWHKEIIQSLLKYGLIGFQTHRDRDNFIWCLKRIVGDLRIKDRGRLTAINGNNINTVAGIFPISIDFSEFETLAMSEDTVERVDKIRRAVPNCQIILGVDRLDYTKGIVLRLKAYLKFLERFKQLHGKVRMIQIIVPSREIIPEYQKVKKDTEQLVNEINTRFGNQNWIPVQYIYGSLDKTELLSNYRAADMILITPVKDGMNLVAKEYCAANVDNDGILILSEFAGAAKQMREHALIINPHDIDEVANTIYRAYYMSSDERRARMQALRNSVCTQDIHWWSNTFLQSAIKLNLQYK